MIFFIIIEPLDRVVMVKPNPNIRVRVCVCLCDPVMAGRQVSARYMSFPGGPLSGMIDCYLPSIDS